MRKILLAILLGGAFLSSSCKNDLDVIDDYHEVMVCYGILDPNDSIHFLRINKAFLGEGNALEMAALADSTTYPVGSLDVRIEQWKNGALIQSYTLTPDPTIPRDSGAFAYPDQILYRANFHMAQDGSIYKMYSHNLATGLTATATMNVINNFILALPAAQNAIDFTDTLPLKVRFVAPANGRRFQTRIRFHYTEQFVFDTTQSSEHYVDWNIGENAVFSSIGGETVEFRVDRSSFYRNIGNQLGQNSNVRRISGKIEVIVIGGNDDLTTYIDVLQALSATQSDIQPYTNITGGIGIFASRLTKTFGQFPITPSSATELRNGAYTSQLGFVR